MPTLQAAPTDAAAGDTRDIAIDKANETPENRADEAADTEADEPNESPAYTSSITVDPADNGASEVDENAALVPLAAITSDEAIAAAIASHPGTVVSTQLENENGSVVHAVLIDTGDTTVDVKVDVGNGTVLASDNGDENGRNADD